MPTLHKARAVTRSMLFSAMKGNTKRKSYKRTKWLPFGSETWRWWWVKGCSFSIISLIGRIDCLGIWITLVKIKIRFKTKNLSPNFFKKPIINFKTNKSYSRKEHKMCLAVNINYIMCQLCSPCLPDPSTLLHLLCAQQADLCRLHQHAPSGFQEGFAPGEPQQDSRGRQGDRLGMCHTWLSF